MNTRIFTVIAASVVFAGMVPASAEAGGLFGKKGVIRGSVGNFVKKRVNPIATPILRGAVVVSGAVGGAIVGTAVGAPNLGTQVGLAVGQGINEVAR
jgi:hypothetical protein